jgi:hypothetical protein
MRPITISLDEETFRLAKNKNNFSDWVRNQLRSERNKREYGESFEQMKAERMQKVEGLTQLSSAELLWNLEQRSDAEITALVSILRGSLPQQ